MRRTALTTLTLTALGVMAVGAQNCTTLGPSSRHFAAGALVIPMDNCYQRRDGTTAPAGCNATADDGVLRAYGLVYFLLKHGVTVYWAIDNTKASSTAADLTVTASSGAAAELVNWDGTATPLTGTPGSVTYLGGPFLVDASDAARVLAMLTSDADPAHADFARFKGEHVVDLHRTLAAADARQVRPLTGPPPKIAILGITPPAGSKTSFNVMYQYAVAAGLSWPCTGNGDCAGGLGAGCNRDYVFNYLLHRSVNQDIDIASTCTGNGTGQATACAPMFNAGPGLVYDVLCDGDFVPAAGGTGYADSQLAKGDYKLLWVPHWDTHGTTPSAAATLPIPPTTAAETLAWQLRDIGAFVQAGNNLFVECLGIQAMEGVVGQNSVNGDPYGIPATQFQSTSGIFSWNAASQSSTLQPFLDPAHPDLQVGDFAYRLVSGAITSYYPDTGGSPRSAYRPGVTRLITASSGTADVAGTIQVIGSDGIAKGNVAYLGGHNYAPAPGGGATSGQTAGTRIVLNTLMNLGFGCADPGTTCQTGLYGACAAGALKCASGGGYKCIGASPAARDLCKGQDDDCNGIVDEGCAPTPICTDGQTAACYSGAPSSVHDTAGAVCHSGTKTCVGGVWGACEGEVVPTPEVCNGKDDDCNGAVDDGTLCPANYACSNGACVPSQCTLGEGGVSCPAGYTCVTPSGQLVGTCQAQGCGAGNTVCGAGLVCQTSTGTCVDPCAAVTCGHGSSCSGGVCIAGGCSLSGCTGGLACVDGRCVADPCAGAACPTGTFCRGGDCVRSCVGVACPAGKACSVDGFCESTCSPACGAGQVCVSGTCQADPCSGITCGSGQTCSGGDCVDLPCSHIQCPEGRCRADGQCATAVTAAAAAGAQPAARAVDAGAPGTGGGCASGGGADLAALAGLALALGLRRRRAALALLAAGLTALAACGGGSSPTPPVTCPSGQTSCSGTCVDLQTSSAHCGSCGHACGASLACTAATCALDTGNPYITALSPTAAALGSQAVAMTITGTGFQAGAQVRVEGAGMASTLVTPSSVSTTGGVSTAQVQISLASALPGKGSATVRVLNPNPTPGGGPLVSNLAYLAVTDSLALNSVSPQSVRQDAGGGALALTLAGRNFAAGATAAMVRSGTSAPIALPVTTPGESQLVVSAPAPGQLRVGTYDVTVKNPDGNVSTAVRFTVTEGAPTLASAPTCAQSGGVLTGTVTGSYLYPSSVVRVSGGSIVDSPLDTICKTGVDATTGQCAGGALAVSADLTIVPAGTYTLSIVNPGPQRSGTADITVQTNACP